jgi:hypothetical protein
VHIRTQLRIAVKERLVAAGVAGGNVYTHDPRIVGNTKFPVVVVEPEIENGIEIKGNNKRFSPRAGDNKNLGRPLVRSIRFSVTAYAEATGTKDDDGNFVLQGFKDADEAADDVSDTVEVAMFDGDHRLMINGARLGETDLRLLGTGGVRNPETGMRQVGVVHHLFEAVVMTDEGDPSVVSNRS